MVSFLCSQGSTCIRPRARWLAVQSQLRQALGLVCLAAVVALPATAQAARVKGKVANHRQLVNPVWQDAKDPKRRGYSFREIVPTVRAEFRKLFPHIPKELCVAALASTPQRAAKMPTLIRVGGGRTTPVTIVVAPGSRLQFKNTDPFTHRLYGVGLKLFPANDTIKGGRREWAVPKAGSYEIRDQLAPSLRTWIIAEPNVAAIAYPSMKGEFMLTVEEPGDYTVQAYFAGKKLGEPVAVTVAVADLDLSNRPIKVAPDPKPAKGDKQK